MKGSTALIQACGINLEGGVKKNIGLPLSSQKCVNYPRQEMTDMGDQPADLRDPNHKQEENDYTI